MVIPMAVLVEEPLARRSLITRERDRVLSVTLEPKDSEDELSRYLARRREWSSKLLMLFAADKGVGVAICGRLGELPICLTISL